MEINLVDLFYYLKKKILVIIAAFLLFAVAGAVFTMVFIPKEYTAKTRIYVLNRSGEADLSSSDYNVADFIVRDYEVLITGENVTREVLNQLNLDMSISELTRKISVSSIEKTRVLQIVVVDTDPNRAAAIANCVREVSSTQIEKIMDVDAVNLVYAATVPTEKSGPNVTENTALSAIVGVILSVSVLTIVHVIDDTIRTDEDVSRYLGLSTLGIIPVSGKLTKVSNTGTTHKKKITDGNSKKPGNAN
jgi:capsular polysaccharide biosynthesis protein